MSNKSESIKNLAVALVAAQAEMPAVELNATNPFLKNRFADLSSVITTAQPVLAKHGLSVSQLPTSSEGQLVGVTTLLMHTSGEWIESTLSLPLTDEKGKSLAQVAGSIITYLRRYSLSAILNMYAEEDTDGSASGQPARKRTASTPQVRTPSAQEKWERALIEMGTTNAKALKCLGTDSVNEWIKAEEGRSLKGAIETINSML